jgi:hypothetical protein
LKKRKNPFRLRARRGNHSGFPCSSRWKGCNPKWKEKVIFWYREPLKTHKKPVKPVKPVNHRDTEAQRKSKAGKPGRLSVSLAFLCVSVVSGF